MRPIFHILCTFLAGALCFLPLATKADQTADLRVWAERGDAKAQALLGIALMNGDGVEKNQVLARTWFEKSAGQNNPMGQNNLGTMLVFGQGGPVDVPLGVTFLEKAVAQGEHAAEYNLAKLLEEGKRVEREIPRAIALYTKASLHPTYTWPQYRLGEIYRTGKTGRIDLAQASTWYRKAALRGHARSQVELAKLIEDGHADSADPWQALVLYTLAMNNGDKDAARSVERLNASPNLELEAPLKKALSSELQTHAGDILKVARSYLFDKYKSGALPPDFDLKKWGNDIKAAMKDAGMFIREADLPRARFLYEIALENGQKKSAFYLGVSYLKGEGSNRDPEKAVHYFKLAQLSSIPEAAYNLGWIYENGLLGQEDLSQAVAHYRNAADSGVPNAYYRLGNMAWHGFGLKRNLNNALKMYKAAQDHSDPRNLLTATTFVSANRKFLQLQDHLARQNGSPPFSDEGSFFHEKGIAHPLSHPITQSIGNISAKLAYCKLKEDSEKFRNSVMSYLEQARTPEDISTLKQRIKDAYTTEISRLTVRVQQNSCPKDRLLSDTKNVIALLQYDWGFKDQPTDEERVYIIDGVFFVIGNIPWSKERENKIMPFISRLAPRYG